MLTIIILAALMGTAKGQSWPFQKYPAHVFRGKSLSPKAETPLAREHISSIRETVQKGPNFAGHYTVVDWGCGTSCAVYVIADNRTGKIYEPPELAKGVELGVAGPEFRADSSLMVVASCAPPEVYGLIWTKEL